MLEQEPISQNQLGFAWLRLLANVFFLGLLPIGLGMLLAAGM